MFNLFSGVHLDSLEDFSKATPLHRFHLQSIQKQPTEVFYKKGVLKISQNSKKKSNRAKAPFLIKLQASGLQLY